MTPRGGTHGNDDDLEVIELESTVTSERTKSRREGRPTTGTRRRRGPVLIAIVVVVALVVSALVNRSSSGRRRASTSTTQPGQAGVGLISVPIFPFRVGALALTGGSRGLQLIDTDTGKMTRPEIAGLPRGSVTIVAQSGGTAAVRVGKQLYWFTMGQRAAHAVGATTAFPSLHRGYLWIADSASATLVPGDTKPIALPGLAIGAARDGGLFVTTEDGVLLQSTTHPAQLRGILSAPATVIAVHADRLAWITNDCGVLRCPVHITEVETDATSTWLQLVGHPGPLVTAGTSGVFSPDGNYLVIIVPDSSATTAEGMVVADLRSRVTTTSYERGRIEEPARPGKVDATGVTIDWTLDSRFLLVAPPAGLGPIGAMDPATGRIVLSRAPIGGITSTAVIGTSAAGSLDLTRRGTRASIDTSGPTLFGTPGLSLVGADDHEIDVADVATGKVNTWNVGRAAPNESGAMARVAGGWLVVRSRGDAPLRQTVVELLPDDGGDATAIASGVQVFSSGAGRHAWIVDETSHVRPYDPVTHVIGNPVPAPGQLAAVAAGLVVASYSETQVRTRIDIIDGLGNVRRGVRLIESPLIELLAAAGTTLVYRVEDGLHVFDLETGSDRVLTPLHVVSVALSPSGEYLAWVYDDFGPPLGATVQAKRVRDVSVQLLGDGAKRVLLADDGTVLFTRGYELWRGRVDANGSNLVYGYAPDSEAPLALG